ncbi:TetR/AcrR family transcriptional regulator [Pontibacter sp. HSC-14F20]|uniref:TetR/AcrR family transcriptional regulator n=1 Tax=Pontibacter sp. HSC-14F20 TaxID=2864136 RepID=UPI001C737632|nr:TetR/AcrR family transcriptional regulator [Pontibacter sp. HSC-14F20]MBX0334316.1 TetR/AcrR family transcriptional regulator [Pontibacter sp. HSC-14F20]
MSKKEAILDAALKLFTENGVRATSTKSIASEANTSEALIFKHYGTKDHLLETIIKKAYQTAVSETSLYLKGLSESAYISSMIELPIQLTRSNPDFWRMQYKIIALNPISSRYHDNFMRPCQLRLTECFKVLGYSNPELEAELLLVHIDGVWKYLAAHQPDIAKEKALVKLMKHKYKL